MTQPATKTIQAAVVPTMAAVVAGYVMVGATLAGFALPPVLWVPIFAVFFVASFR